MAETRKLEADVIIVAGGMSGLCASIAAAEKEASVIVFEKGGTVGGAANMGMGFFGVESHIQKKQLENFTVADAFKRMMEYNHWRADAMIIRKYYEQSASTVKWVEDMGVEFLGAFKYFKDSEATWHIPRVPGSNKPNERCASLIVKALYDRAQELGVRFEFYTPVTKIIREGNRVTGVMAVDADGNEIIGECDAVIVCTGGFGDNPEMIKNNLGYSHGQDLFSFRIPGLKGEGMKMVWDIGAGKSDVNMEMTYESPGFAGGNMADTIFRQPNLMLNFDGKRFIDESIMRNTPFTGNAINLQKNRTGFSIAGDETINSYLGSGLDFTGHHKEGILYVDGWREIFDAHFADSDDDDNEDKKHARQLMGIPDELETFYEADSLEELAEKTGMNKENLIASVGEYNGFCAAGKDPTFYKDSRFLRPITGKKYYALKFFPSGYGSLGGIKVNDMLQVVTQDGDPIPGLYSAGTDCCTIFGDTYIFYFPGSTMGWAINSGRMAGYNAVNYLDSDEFVED